MQINSPSFERSKLSSLRDRDKPSFIKMKLPHGDELLKLKNKLNSKQLNTVCQEARCPNITECWSAGTATIMILGDTCTRFCKFCNVKTGNPKGVVDREEPQRVADQLSESHFKYVVITCVDRDDLEDGGAFIFGETIRKVKMRSPHLKIEALISDYRGEEQSLRILLEGRPDVVAHNLETVRMLTPLVRDKRADYDQSLTLLSRVKEIIPGKITKSSLMVGLGETKQELEATCLDLRNHGVDIVTFGQYLRPSSRHLSVKRYYRLEEFRELESMARNMGFIFVASGPLVRSSYRAAELFTLKHLTNTY